MAYYQRLKDLKEDADLTQAKVSEIIDVSTNHYGKYERGDIDIPFSKAIIHPSAAHIPAYHEALSESCRGHPHHPL